MLYSPFSPYIISVILHATTEILASVPPIFSTFFGTFVPLIDLLKPSNVQFVLVCGGVWLSVTDLGV